MYKFTSSRQLIFKITKPGGTPSVVYFSERDANGVSVFLTKDENTAQAIMRHSFFKKGVIILAEKPAEPEEEDTDTEAEQEDTNDIQEQTTDAETTEAPVEAESETTETIPEDGVMKFPNITIAKDYLHRTFGVKKEEIRSLPKVLAYAESKGITIVIGD